MELQALTDTIDIALAAESISNAYTHGAIVPKPLLLRTLGVPQAKPDTPWVVGQAWQLAWVGRFEDLRMELLRTHKKDLRSVQGEGYKILPPCEQTAAATERLYDKLSVAFRRCAAELANVETGKLTHSEIAENRDAQAKLAGLRAVVRAAAP